MRVVRIFGRRYVWLLDHHGKLFLTCVDKKKPVEPYTVDETLVRCDRFDRFQICDFSPVKDPPEGLFEVAYAACKKYLQTNGDG